MYIKKAIRNKEDSNVLIKSKDGYRLGAYSNCKAVASFSDKELVDFYAGQPELLNEVNREVGTINPKSDTIQIRELDGTTVCWIYEHEKIEIPNGLYKTKVLDHREYLQPYEAYKSLGARQGENRITPIVKQHFGTKNKNTGALLYGPPGNGKTTDILELTALAEELQLICILTRDLDLLEDFRPLLKDRNVVIILEEVSTAVSNERDTAKLLNQLDGVDSFNRCLTLMTTNSIENFPANIVDRPGRIKHLLKYDNPNAVEIKEIATLCCVTDDISILLGKALSRDYIMTIFDDAKQSGQTVEQVYKEFKKQRDMVSISFKTKVGL